MFKGASQEAVNDGGSVGVREDVDPAAGRVDESGGVAVAMDAELRELFEEAVATLAEGYVPGLVVLYPLYLDLPSAHCRYVAPRSLFLSFSLSWSSLTSINFLPPALAEISLKKSFYPSLSLSLSLSRDSPDCSPAGPLYSKFWSP